PDRRARQHDDSCIDCHMPRRDAADIAHVAMSDHRIPRAAGVERPEPSHAPAGTRADPPGRFGPRRADGPPDAGGGRAPGTALVRAARPVWRPNAPMGVGRRAVALLDAGLDAHPDDVPALEAKAHFLWMQGKPAEARAAFQSALRAAPDH